MMREKVLFCITVYNGKAFVPRAIQSAVAMSQKEAEVSVLILDDASPEPGWSQELEKICLALGANYYCTPRNLGIPRNVNLGLLTAANLNFDYVVICNSDTIFANNTVDQLVSCWRANKTSGAITAWSNNVSIYSLPNCDPDAHLAEQKTVDEISTSLEKLHATDLVDIPAGISFCILIPTAVVRDVGLTDPCFGRGYCEETDLSLRTILAGYRMCLAPGVFVYHQGRGSNLSAGLVSAAATTVPKNEAIIDLRYPDFRKTVDKFIKSGVTEKIHKNSLRHIITSAAKDKGYCLATSAIRLEQREKQRALFCQSKASPRQLAGYYRGFSHTFDLGSQSPAEFLLELIGASPAELVFFDRDSGERELVEKFPTTPVKNLTFYPSNI